MKIYFNKVYSQDGGSDFYHFEVILKNKHLIRNFLSILIKLVFNKIKSILIWKLPELYKKFSIWFRYFIPEFQVRSMLKRIKSENYFDESLYWRFRRWIRKKRCNNLSCYRNCGIDIGPGEVKKMEYLKPWLKKCLKNNLFEI